MLKTLLMPDGSKVHLEKKTHARYAFRHYREMEGRDLLIWGNGVGDLTDEVFRGSPEELEIIKHQVFDYNELADEGESAMLDVFYRNGTAPTFFFSLYNDTPVDTDTLATLVNEVSGTGYARIAVARNTTDFPTLGLQGGDFRVDSVTKQFSAGGSWTAATQLVLGEVSTGTAGDFYAWAALSATRTLVASDTLDVSMQIQLA